MGTFFNLRSAHDAGWSVQPLTIASFPPVNALLMGNKLIRDNLVNSLTGFAFEICPVAGPLKRESRALKKRKQRA